MDSLLANYAGSSSEDDEKDNHPQQEINSNSSRGRGRGSLFASLPLPKEEDANSSSIPPPKKYSVKTDKTFIPSSSLFSCLPPPKTKTKTKSKTKVTPTLNKSAKRLVEFKPPFNSALLQHHQEDDDDDDDDGGARNKKVRCTLGGGGGGLTSLLPPAKNDNAFGSGGRGSIVELPATATQEPPITPIAQPCQYAGEYDYSTDASSQGDYGIGEAAWSQYWQVPQQTYDLVPQVAQQQHKADKKGARKEGACDVIEVKQDELIGNRPREDKNKLTGIAFGPAYKPVSAAKDKPSKLHKRKHQIGSLYYDLKQKEMELAERRARGQLTKSETQAKYGW